MASIRKRNGKYQVQVRRAGYQTLSRTFTHRKDAQEWANETELKADRRGMPENLKEVDKMTLGHMLVKYRDTVLPSKKSHKNEAIILNAFLRHPICKKYLPTITPEDFEKYMRGRLIKVKGSTVNRELNIIRHAYNTAINIWAYPILNPISALKKAQEAPSRTRRLHKNEEGLILTLANQKDSCVVSDIIQFALETGMRRSEIMKIKSSNINLQQQTLSILESKNGHSRVIPLSNKACSIIKRYKRTNRDEVLFPITIKGFEYHWQSICKKASLDDLHFHDLRHEAISRFFEKGLSVPEVALISGHRDYRMLFRYTHMKPENILGKLN